MKQGTQSLCSGTTQRNRMGRKVNGGFRIGGTNAFLWPIHVDVWQKPSQYCNYSPFKIINKKYTPENFSQAIEFQLCIFFFYFLSSVQFSSVAQLCPTLCAPMNHSTPGLPVHHHLLEFTQTHVHRVSDAIQPSHPQSSPSPPAPNPSQHQSLFQ